MGRGTLDFPKRSDLAGMLSVCNEAKPGSRSDRVDGRGVGVYTGQLRRNISIPQTCGSTKQVGSGEGWC